MSEIRFTIDDITDRWEITSGDVSRLGEIEEIEAGLCVARDDAGVIRLALIDRESLSRLSDESRDALRLSFDVDIVSMLSNQVVIDRSQAHPDVDIAPLAGEPGSPEPVGENRFVVPRNEAPIEIRDDGRSIQIVLPASSTGSWVRISHADSGAMVALGSVRARGDQRQSTVTYGLDLPMTELHFEVSDSPLTPVPDRHTRRRQWLGRLLRSARGSRFTRPIRARRSAIMAGRVADSLADEVSVASARRLARSAMFAIIVRALLVIAMVTAVVIVAVGRGSSPPRVTSSGDSLYRFTDGSSVELRLIRRATGEYAFLVTERAPSTAGFGRDPDKPDEPLDEERYRRVCLENTEMDVSTRTDYEPVPTELELYLIDENDPSRAPVLLSREVGSRRVVHQSVDPRECRRAKSDPDGVFNVPSTVTLEQLDIALDPLGGDVVGQGSWRVMVVRSGSDGMTLTGTSTNPQTLIID